MTRHFGVSELEKAIEGLTDCKDLVANGAGEREARQLALLVGLAEEIVQGVQRAPMEGRGLTWVCFHHRQEDRFGNDECFSCKGKKHGRGDKGCDGHYLIPLRIVPKSAERK
jgi:hypothetical protein